MQPTRLRRWIGGGGAEDFALGALPTQLGHPAGADLMNNRWRELNSSSRALGKPTSNRPLVSLHSPLQSHSTSGVTYSGLSALA